MAYLIQNTRTDDFIQDVGGDWPDWTPVRSFAKRFATRQDAERFIAKNQVRGDESYMKVVKESTHRSFKKFMEAKKLTEDKRYDDEIVRKAFMTALGGKNWNNFIQAGYDGKLHTWNEINNFLVKAGASFNDCAKVSNKLEDLEDDHHYADCVYEGCKTLKEDVDQKIVIHTKNGKVDSIEQGTYIPNGVFIRNGGHHFDKGFIGMDPQEAKSSLVKFSKYNPDSIIID